MGSGDELVVGMGDAGRCCAGDVEGETREAKEARDKNVELSTYDDMR